MSVLERAPVQEGVLWLTLSRPEKRNALDDALVAALKAGLREAEADPEVRVVGIRGSGTDFCSGADLSALEKMSEAGVLENLEDVDSLAELFLLLRNLRKPVVAAVHGRALAGGCGLATGCDLVVAAESARFGYPEVRIGFVPAMVMALLRRNLSEKRAFELITLGEVLSAAEAEGMGLINRRFPDESFESEAQRFAAELASRSPSAVQLCKRLLYQTDAVSYETAIRAGADVNVLARMTEDTRAGVKRFLAGRG